MARSMARWLLAFDTSTPRSVIVVGRADEPEPTVADARTDGANQASATLVSRIEQAVSKARLKMQDLDLVVCGNGPGTFTGTRVGVATAKGLSFGLACPLYACGTLHAIAASSGVSGPVLATLDARRTEVYAGLVDVEHGPDGQLTAINDLQPPQCAPLVNVLAGPLPAGVTLVGPGVDAYTSVIGEDLRDRHRPGVVLTARGLWQAARAIINHTSPCDRAEFDAVYLRASYAEMGVNQPKRPFKPSPFVDPSDG